MLLADFFLIFLAKLSGKHVKNVYAHQTPLFVHSTLITQIVETHSD